MVGLADRDRLHFEIEVRRCKRQQLAFPDPGPVEHEDMYDFRIANIDDFRIYIKAKEKPYRFSSLILKISKVF